MDYQQILKKINNSQLANDTRRRGHVLSQVETIREILISKGIISESGFNKILSENLKRNFK
jgi:hypothetical protein